MKTITFEKEEETINLINVKRCAPIFMMENNHVIGMLVQENRDNDEYWIIRIGGSGGVSGFHETRELAIKGALDLNKNYKFAIDIEIK